MNSISQIIGFLMFIGLGLLACWKTWDMLRNSEDPFKLGIKWSVTLLYAFGLWWCSRIGPFGLLISIPLSLIVGIMWASNLGNLIASPLGSFYTGGSREIEPRPLYSMAEAKRKRGDYPGAITEVEKQLARFPEDFEGLLLLAEIQAGNLGDLEAAREAIESILSTDGHASRNLTFALNRLADWELRLGHNPEAARIALERIVSLFPESEQAQMALQRIAHLRAAGDGPTDSEPHKFVVGEHQLSLGLQESAPSTQAVDDPVAAAADCVRHLQEHPHDFEVRERLAEIYASHYQRLDLAADQLEFLIGTPNQPARQVVRWLNRLADLQVLLIADADRVRTTLLRICEAYPNSAAAQNAQNRIAYLNREIRSKEKSQVVRLGSYEQNIGLKGGKPTG